jgi:amino acid adenylation domain-containing protein
MLTKDNISNIYTLSPMQEGMYFHYLYDKSSPAYFIQSSYRINGDLHVQLMEKSLNELFKRYDILRTVFMHKKGKKLFQVVLKESRIDFHYENISAAADKEDYLGKFKKKDRKRSFDLGKDVLMRASVIQLDKFEYEFTLSFHHILMDGWCIPIIMTELAEIYNSYLERKPYRLPEAKQYRIYIKWLESQDREAAREYWEKYLQHYEGTASIPGLGKNNNNYQNENYTVEWEQEKTKKLEKIAVKYQVTLNTIFQSVWGVLLGKYNGKQDVVFGAVVSGRPAEIRDVESMVGLFINTIPVRIQYEEQSKFVRLLKHVQEKVVACDSYSYYPLAQIQALTKPKQNLFDHIIAFENYPAAEQIDSLMTANRELNFKVSDIMIFEQTTYDFNIQAGLGQQLTINFLYNANNAGNRLIRRVANHLVRLLDQLIDNEEVIIDQLSFLSETEKNMILYEINDTTAGYPANKTIHDLFAGQVAKTPDNTALILGNEQLSYNQLDKNALQWARILRDNGASEDHIIGLILERSLEMIIVIMAVLKAGGAYLPIDANYPPNRITFMLKDSQVELIVSRKTRVNHVSLPARTIYLEDKLTYSLGTANLPSISRPHSMAYIIYTSGTTGKPKGVIIENRNVVRLMMNDRFQFNFNSRDTWTLFHSYGFDFSVWEMYGALLYGGKLVIIREMVAKDPARFLALLKKWGVTVLNQTPSAFYNLQDEELKTGTRHLHLKYVIFGGEALKPVKLKQWKEKYPGTRLINMFGITETTVHVTYKEITEKEISFSQSNIGRPIPTLRLYIMDKNHHVLPVGVSGELCVGGLGPARGYLNRIELSGMKFVPNPYITGDKLYKSGDLGRLLDNGDIEYLGRIDNQMQLRGFRIELGEIENQLLGYKDIKECVVLVKEDKNEHQYLCAYIVPGKQIVSSKLRDYLSKRLPAHMIPNYFVPIEKIPLTLNGKINRHALPEPLMILENQDAHPRNEIEENLLQIWQKELAVDNIGIKDSFFNLGGDSIKAIGLLSAINEALNSNLKIEDIFINDTIEQLAPRISAGPAKKYDNEWETAAIEIEKLKTKILAQEKLSGDIEDIYPMSDIQIGMIYYADKYLDKAMYFEQFIYQTQITHFEMDTFKRILNLISDRQPMLRTGFNLKDFEQPVQIVYKNAEIDVKYRDISDKSIEDQEKYITQFMENERQNPFIISLPPLLKVVVFESLEENFIFLWEFHHAVADGWSFASFITELNNTYFTLKSNPHFIPKKLKCSYKDFVIEQMIEKKSEKIVNFWKKELDSYKRIDFSFLNDHRNSIGMGHTKKIYNQFLGISLSESLMKAARQYNISLKNICFGAYAYMLNMLSYENDFVVGVVTHNRPTREDSEKIFGCFINTVPVRIKIPARLTWGEYIQIIDQKMTGLKKFEKLSFFEIIKIIREKSRGENPLFDTVFNFVNFHILEQLMRADQVNNNQYEDIVQLSLGKHENTNTLFDFTVNTNSSNFMIEIIYSEGIFKVEQVDSLFGYFKSTLTNIISNPGNIIEKEELISTNERKELLYGFNNTVEEYPGNKTIHELFEEQVERTPDNISLYGCMIAWMHGEDESITYKELNEKSNQLAHVLRSNGVGTDTIAAIMIKRSPEMIIGLLGILKSGGAYLPIDPEYPGDRIQYMLTDSSANVLITTDTPAKKVKRCPETIFIDSLDFSNLPSSQLLNLSTYPSSLAYVIYTSGTTGVPKGVLIRHQGVVNMVKNHHKIFAVNPGVRFSQIASATFDAMANEVWPSLLAGAVLCIVNNKTRLDPREMKEWLIKHHITNSFQPTHMAELLLEEQWPEHGVELKALCAAGERLTLYPIRSYPFCFYNLYGPTEDTVWTTWIELPVNPRETRGHLLPPIGKPIANKGIYILNQNLKLQPLGVAGELCIGGVGLARGYLNQPALTNEKFCLRQPGGRFLKKLPPLTPHKNFLLSTPHSPHSPRLPIYRTGDLARWMIDGNIEFLGRIDNQVKIRGFRIELGEIENRLLKYEKVKEAVVILKEDKSGDRCLCAYFTSGSEISIPGLRKHLTSGLPDYMIPAHFIKLDKLPLTPNGKIDRNALPGLEAISETGYAAPRDPVEDELATIWSTVLGIEKEKISIDANFFEIGGHSLKAVVLIAKIHKTFDIKLQLSELFNKTTIRELSGHIKSGTENKYRSIEFAELKEHYPLSSPQKRLFILYQFDRESTGYNIPIILLLEGKIHKQKFEETFMRLIERHESLRTSFALAGNESVQVIHGDIAFNIEYFQDSPDPVIKDFIRPFDLAKAPLIRVGLIRTAADRHVFIVDMHHIIADGVSLGILVRDFMSIYAGKHLSPLKLQYKEYSQWQNRELQKGEIAKQQNYWLERFENGVPILELPTDFNRPPLQSFAGNSVSFEIGEKQKDALNRLALEMGCTLYMVLIALYSIFLAKISNQEDIVIGSPTAGRDHADLESIIGIFLNTLPLRTGPVSSKTFTKYVSNLRETILTAFENQDYPYEDLVKNVSVDRDMSRNPLFDVMFILQSMDTGILEIPGLKISPYQHEHTSAKFDLTLIAREEEEKIYFTLEYCTALFRDSTARGFVQYFKNTINAALQDPGIKIAGIEIITPREKKRILFDFNNTRKEYPGGKTIHQLFTERASIIPDKIALVFENAHLTYKGLHEKVDSLARLLKSKGVAPNRVVGLSMERSLEMITGIYGILAAGGAYLPCDPNYPEKRVKYMFEKSETRLLLSRGGLVAKYRDMPVPGEVIDIDASYAPCADKNRIHHSNRTDDLAYLIFTSGSTGNPKGILIEHKSVVNFIEGIANIIDFSPGKTILAVTTISFDIFVLETLLPLAKGLKVVIAAERHQNDPDLLSEIILKIKVNMVQLTPSRLKMLIAVNRLDCLKEVRELMVGGEAFPGDLLACLQKSFKGKIFNMYGPTETTVWSTVKDLTLSAEINIGTPIANTYIYILDKNHNLQPIGITGELGIGGTGTARGYLNNPELTADKFDHDERQKLPGKIHMQSCNHAVMHPRSHAIMPSTYHLIPPSPHSPIYRTGDMARWLPDGNIDFLGRVDEQVKIRGFRIETGEIEGLLLTREGIKEVVVTTKDDSMGNKCLCAYYISDMELSVSDLRKYCSGSLPEYMIPSYFMSVEKFPLTPNGKIHRKLLPNPEIKTGAPPAAPRNETEKKLVEIWCRVLAVQAEQISIDTNFFELGGHSLTAVILISIIHKELAVKIPLTVFFKKPNIRDLSQSISEMAKDIYISILPAEKREYYPLSSAQMRLYVIQQMEPGNLVYNFPQAFTCEGKLHREKLEQSFKQLIRRHVGLRTSFLMVEEETCQRINDDTEFKIEYYEMNGGDAAAVIKKFIRPFDLSKPPLRAGLAQIEKNKHLLILDMHHIITDFVSNRVLVDDFTAIYEKEPLPALRLQYTDFSQWHNELLKSGQIKKQERYWLEVFKEEVPPLNLPTDFSTPGVSNGEGCDLPFTIENDKYDMLNELRRQTGTTFFVLLLTIYYILLYKYTGKEDIVIANPTAGRYHPDLEGIIGVFINLLAMRNRPRGNKTFNEFINEVKENTLAALENQDFQFDELVKKLGLQRNTKTNPLNDCVFNYIDVRTNEERKELSSEIKISPYEYERNVNPFNLLLIAAVTENMINMILTYPSLLFKRTTMEKMTENYMNIINQVSEDREIRLADIKLSHDLFIAKSSVQRKEESDFNF